VNFQLYIFLTVLLAFRGIGFGQPILKLDFNDRSGNPSTNTFTGFASFLINSNFSATTAQTNATTRSFGSIIVSLSGTGQNPGYNDQQRTTPTNTATFTEALLLRDFVQSDSQRDNGGLDVAISGLGSNQLYAVTIWSFDPISDGRRVSDWSANGQLLVDNYTFDGRVPPGSNDSYRFAFYAPSDAAGRLLIAGRRDSTSVNGAGRADFGVFLNALQLEAVLRISRIESKNGNLILRVDSPQATRVHYLEQTPTLRSPVWSEVTNAVFSGPTNNSLTVTVPGPVPTPRFYRARY